ncbi:MAG: sensor histidine kinase, partial [Gammaproteobacteria bacterium]
FTLLDSLASLPLAGAHGTGSEEVRRRILATKIRSAIGVMPRNAAAGVAGVAIGVLGMGYTGAGAQFRAEWPLILWAAMVLSVISIGIVLAVSFNQAEHSDEEAIRSSRANVVVFALSGAAWGCSSWLLLPGTTFHQDAFLLAGISLVLMGGSGAQAVHRPLVLGFSLSLAVVFITGMVRLFDPIHLLLSLEFAVYTGLVLVYTRSQEAVVTMAIELALENEELLAQRTEQERCARLARSVAEQAREQAEKADRSKTNFIAATSHDLRQPMHALVQYVGHLRRSCRDPLAEPTIDRMEDSIAAMENLLNGVLDFTKISMGAIKPDIRVFPVDHLLRSVDTQIRPLAQAKGLAFRVESDGGHVESDEILLERIIRNVGQNAVRYTESGTVVIRARLRGALVRVLVCDSGIGVPAAEHGRIFEEYYQVDNHARDRRKGLGLGLAIVRDLARLLELRVRVKSAPGRGSTFAIEAPRARSAAPVTAAAQESRQMDFVRGAFAVLIDDDPLALDGLAVTL